MKIQYTNGCICNSLTIDGNESIDMSTEEFRDAVCKVYEKFADEKDLFERAISDYIDMGESPECSDEDVWIANNTVTLDDKEVKLKHTYICLDEYIHIDNDTFEEKDMEYLKKLGYECLLKQTDTACLQDLLIDIAQTHGKYKYIGHCDCCGDTIVEYTITI